MSNSFSFPPAGLPSFTVPFRIMGIALLMTGTGYINAGESSSPWEPAFTAGNGFSLSHRGIPIIRQSTLYVVRPGWTGLIYNQTETTQNISRLESPGGAGLLVEAENMDFRVSYRFEPLDDRRFQLVFEGALLRDIPADIEYSIGYFNANLLAGRPFRAETAHGPVDGRVADFPAGTDQLGNDLAPYFRSLEIDSRIGALRLDVDAGEERVLFFDARRDPQGWARRAPVFWCGIGVPSRSLSVGQPVRVEMLITLDPIPLPTREETGLVEAKGEWIPDARSTRDRPFQIIPTPKNARVDAGCGFQLRDGLFWSISSPHPENLLEEAVSGMLSENGLEARRRQAPSSQQVVIRLDRSRSHRPLRPRAGDGTEWLAHPEGYRLTINQRGIEIVSSTALGAMHGLRTLAQLLRPDDAGRWVPHAVVEDWPVLGFRGVHWFPSASGVPFHRKLTERIVSAFKFNHAVIQCEAAVWDSHPEIAAPNSISKEDLAGLVALHRGLFLEPVPLINIPGHAEWIFRNGRNLHLAEDPETPYAYCVNHPGSQAFIEPILEEAIEIFQSPLFHLGHDEVTMRGRFPHPDCPRCQGETATSLVVRHMHRKRDWLNERGIRMTIWGDMMLAPEEIPDTAAFAPNVEEAVKRRTQMPRDMIITDWHYDVGEDYPSLDIFHELGHPVIASTWHNPLNIRNFSRAAVEAEAMGLLQTTWAGFFPDEGVLRDGLHQFSAFLLAAEYAWTGRSDLPPSLPFDPGSEFLRAYFDPGQAEGPGRMIDLSTVARTPRENWLGLGSGWDFTRMPSGRQRMADVLFNIPENLAVVGESFGPEGTWGDLTVNVVGRAGEMVLLHCAAFGAPAGTLAAKVTIRHRDGTETVENLVLGRNTAHWGNDSPTMRATVGWQQPSPAETPMAMRVTRIQLTHPEKELASIRFSPGAPEQAWALAGLTLLD